MFLFLDDHQIDSITETSINNPTNEASAPSESVGATLSSVSQVSMVKSCSTTTTAEQSVFSLTNHDLVLGDLSEQFSETVRELGWSWEDLNQIGVAEKDLANLGLADKTGNVSKYSSDLFHAKNDP